MREIGPVRWHLGSTPEEVDAARPYLGIARTQLGITKNLMALGGLRQGARAVTLPDGTVIRMQSVFGQDTVAINPVVPNAAQIGPAETPVEPQRILKNKWQRLADGPPMVPTNAVWDDTQNRLLVFGWPNTVTAMVGTAGMVFPGGLYAVLIGVSGARDMNFGGPNDFLLYGGSVAPGVNNLSAPDTSSHARAVMQSKAAFLNEVNAKAAYWADFFDAPLPEIFAVHWGLCWPGLLSFTQTMSPLQNLCFAEDNVNLLGGLLGELWQFTEADGWAKLGTEDFNIWLNVTATPFWPSYIGSSVGISPTRAQFGDSTALTPTGVKFNFGGTISDVGSTVEVMFAGAIGDLWMYDPNAV